MKAVELHILFPACLAQLDVPLPEVLIPRDSEPERAIGLAALLPASKVTFVLCDCGLAVKEALIQAVDLVEAGRLLCECGGHRTMSRMIHQFLASGELLPEAA